VTNLTCSGTPFFFRNLHVLFVSVAKRNSVSGRTSYVVYGPHRTPEELGSWTQLPPGEWGSVFHRLSYHDRHVPAVVGSSRYRRPGFEPTLVPPYRARVRRHQLFNTPTGRRLTSRTSDTRACVYARAFTF